MDQESLFKVIEILKDAQRVLFITGAGISAESGLPTYRGVGGLYNGENTAEDMPIEVALSGDILQSNPEITWKYLVQVESNCQSATYNEAHRIIAEMEHFFAHVCVFTQNIDGFHLDAGSKNVIEIHGNYHYLLCQNCQDSFRVEDYSQLTFPPHCAHCQGMIRPQVVLFGETLPMEKMMRFYEEREKGFDAYIWIGTSAVFPYIQEPLIDARKRNAMSVEINPVQSEISGSVDIQLEMSAGEALSFIWNALKAEESK